MPSYTDNLGLVKWNPDDFWDATDYNENMEKLDDNAGNNDSNMAYVAVKSGNNWQLPSGKNAAIGEFIVLNGVLGHATAAITGGSTNIVSGTNWTPETKGGLNALNDKKLDIANVYNGLDKTASGFALDARQGKALDDKVKRTEIISKGLSTSSSAVFDVVRDGILIIKKPQTAQLATVYCCAAVIHNGYMNFAWLGTTPGDITVTGGYHTLTVATTSANGANATWVGFAQS